MLDEEMDDIIREAASKHHPAYNDTAWEKMQQKLDIHLPQKDDRRRYIYWLLLFLLLSGSVFTGLLFYYNNKEKNDKQQLAAEKNNAPASQNQAQGTSTPSGTTGTAATGNTNTGTDQQPADNKGPASTLPNTGTGSQHKANTPADVHNNTLPADPNQSAGKNNIVPATGTRNSAVVNGKSYRKRKGQLNMSVIAPGQLTANDPTTAEEKLYDPAGKRKITQRGRTRMQVNAPQVIADKNNKPGKKKKQEKPVGEEEMNEEPVTIATTPVDPATYQQHAEKENTLKPATGVLTNNAPGEKKKEEKEITKEEQKKTDSAEKRVTVSNKKPEEKKKKGFGSNFGITVSAGADISFITLSKPGKATFIYGAGLSYDFAKRFTVQAGFLASKKIYTALPDQYEQGTTYPYLQDIDAVCKVYEIPVSITYRFAEKRNHNWFGGVGLSSFIMKKEDYDYNYKYPGGPSYQYRYSYANENKHYFSVLSLFAGYQYKLSDRISFMAGPYFKLPLGGVGAGKIKLNSGGLLLTATVKPFAKKKS